MIFHNSRKFQDRGDSWNTKLLRECLYMSITCFPHVFQLNVKGDKSGRWILVVFGIYKYSEFFGSSHRKYTAFLRLVLVSKTYRIILRRRWATLKRNLKITVKFSRLTFRRSEKMLRMWFLFGASQVIVPKNTTDSYIIARDNVRRFIIDEFDPTETICLLFFNYESESLNVLR